MQEDDLKLHIVVNDEVIDLRNEVFDKEYFPIPSVKCTTSVSPFFTKGYGSEPVLPKAKAKRRIPISKDLQKPKVSDIGTRFQEGLERRIKSQAVTNDGLKKLAETLYSGPISYSSLSNSTTTAISKTALPSTATRNKPILRSKIPNSRLAAIDPRFRRARSPSSKNHTLVTQSESRVSPANSERRKSKSQSDSKFLLNSQASDGISTPRIQIGDNQGDSVASNKKLLTHKSGYTNTKIDKSEDLSIKADNNKPNDEDPTITETTTIVGVSLYQSAVSGDSLAASQETELHATVTLVKLYDETPYKPFWDDPRLIDKYGKFLKPVTIAPRNSLSSWTLPIQKHSRYYNDVVCGDYQHCLLPRTDSRKQLFKRTCSKCICTFDNETVFSEESTGTMSRNEPQKDKLCSLIYTNYLLAVFFAVGSLCGLLLVALVVWVIANDLIWTYLQKNAEPKLTGIASWVAYVFGGVIYGIMYVFRTVGYLFVMPRNEVYDSGTRANAEQWYDFLKSWM